MKRFIVILCVMLAAGSVVFASGVVERLKPSPYFLGLDTKTVTNAWESYFQDSFEWYSQDNHWKWITNEAGGDPAAQITQCRQMINSGVKGLIVSAQDKEAAKPIVDFATAAKIPVFTADADIDSPNVKMYVGFSGEGPVRSWPSAWSTTSRPNTTARSAARSWRCSVPWAARRPSTAARASMT